MRKREPVLYLTSWDKDKIIKIGFSSRRRWRSFKGARVVLTIPFQAACPGYDFELDCHLLAFLIWPQAFATREDAIPFLGGKGAGYLECYRVTADEGLELLASQCAVTVERHSAASHRDDTLPRHGRTDGRTDVLTTEGTSLGRKTYGRYARTRGEIS
jgi:hypothetical protein